MYVVNVLDEKMKLINSHYESTKPTGAVKLDILHRYEDGVYIRVQEMETEEDIQNEPTPALTGLPSEEQGGTL